MTFTTLCFVRVENPEKRKELIEWLCDIGRPHRKVVPLNVFPFIVAYDGWHDNVSIESLNIYQEKMPGLIDCGANIDLFKALAAMNNENDREQWYSYTEYPTNEGKNGVRKFVFNEPARFDSFVDVPSGYYRKATAEEIVEYFKNKER